MLRLENLTYRVGARTLLDGASVTIPQGHKVGLVGRNGTGKSTLLRLIEGKLTPDAGEISVAPRLRIGGVAQEMPDADGTPLQFVLAADRERETLTREAETTVDPHRLGEIYDRLDAIGAHSAEARAASILAGLGFDEAAQARPLGSYSGGWRMRVALAATLFAAPDVLLLDEPSNHLDLETRIWLEGYLKSYQGTILLVSHDRDLLNSVTDSILHLHGLKLTLYRGNYDRFDRTRREALAHQEAAYARQMEQRRHMQAFVDRFRYKASKARQAQSRLKALERMEIVAPVEADSDTVFRFPDPVELPSPLVTIDRVAVGYGSRPVLKGLNLTISADDRIGLLGANGNGKTTFLRLVLGQLRPLQGEIIRSPKLRVGYFEQEQADAFDLESTPVAVMSALMPNAPEAKVRAHLGRFGLTQERATTRIGQLSGGEKARLLFACVTYDAPHILLLDEPTNHLDIDARDALVQALAEYRGAVLLVTHDPRLVELCADRLWLVADGTCRAYDGDVADYRRQLAEERRAERADAKRNDAASATSRIASKKERRQADAAVRAALAGERKRAREAEKRVERLSAERSALQARLTDPKLYEGTGDEVSRLQIRLAEVEQAITEAETEWLEAQEALESAVL